MDKLRLHGPTQLRGKVRASGAKNAALPALAASLLASEPLELEDVPRVVDIRTMRRLLADLGVESAEQGDLLVLRPHNGNVQPEAPYELVKTMRASVLVLGPLLARWGHARVSLPGGCAIGVRPIDQHLAALEALGAEVNLEHGYVEARSSGLKGARFRFSGPTVTGTENVMMAACLASGVTVLERCAAEPEVADLASLLNAMGASIEGAGTETVTIRGVEALGGARHRVIPDRIEAGTYLLGALITDGDVTVEGVRPADLAPLLSLLREAGARVDEEDGAVRARRNGGHLAAAAISTAPHPGFPTDLQAQTLALMTQASGTASVRETVFENRFQHVPELQRMGAQIELQSREALVRGPTPLSGAKVMATDLRASASLVLAGLAAEGETTVDRIYHLDRGYEAMEQKLRALGACVERLRE